MTFWIDLLLAMTIASFAVWWFKDVNNEDKIRLLRVIVLLGLWVVLLNRCLL